MKHRIAHLLGWNLGRVKSFYIEDKLWVGFRCNTCGSIDHALPNPLLDNH